MRNVKISNVHLRACDFLRSLVGAVVTAGVSLVASVYGGVIWNLLRGGSISDGGDDDNGSGGGDGTDGSGGEGDLDLLRDLMVKVMVVVKMALMVMLLARWCCYLLGNSHLDSRTRAEIVGSSRVGGG
ncbi:hypothetical protein Tco_0808414 [Tanacetum coccineum]